eukprot:NODE_1277_length_1605_cov_21.548843_g1142_i0.p1 GENE.NODE_1277_length_1605_cov_21.548843_g1142_i0~~NODE_1277_length_1605_cov_21.548843_g1142_i0.p1  ORF type:complete len:440 (+),score=74.59 NODE_1277_length_1605_cov_21.548843_g1142_i0:62-1321(+)
MFAYFVRVPSTAPPKLLGSSMGIGSMLGRRISQTVPQRWRSSLSEARASAAPTLPASFLGFHHRFSSKYPPEVIPQFQIGEPAVAAERFVIDCSAFVNTNSQSLGSPVEHPEVVEKMKTTFDATGLVQLKNTGLRTLKEMEPWARVIIPEPQTYEGGANARQLLEQNVYDAGAPSQAWLHYHYEMAYLQQSPVSLGFCCSSALSGGRGRTYVSDGLQATQLLMRTDLGQKMKTKGVCRVRTLTDAEKYSGKNEHAVYNHWQQSYMTDSAEEAEARAREQGLEVEWGPGRLMMTRFSTSGFEYFPKLDANLLYINPGDDHIWFDTWPGVQDLAPADRPIALLFGDGTSFSLEEIKLFAEVFDRAGTPIEWEVGDVTVLCNHRFAHGRPGYAVGEGEERTLGVVIGPMFAHVGALEGKWLD